MGSDNGGVVVNLSEAGLGFQAVSPVVSQAEIPISFSLGTGYRIDVKARVAWVSSEGKAGGLVFGRLSKDSRSLVHEWLAKAQVDHEDAGDGASNAAPANASREAGQGASAAAATVSSQEAVRAGSSGTESRPLLATTPAAREVPVPTERSACNIAASSILQPIRPTREGPPEQECEPTSGRPLWTVPSTSTSSRSDAQTFSVPQGNMTALFPPRSAENDFTRPQSHAKNAREGSRSGKLFVLGAVIVAAAVAGFYVRTHRQRVGAAIVRIGETVAGKPGSGGRVSANSAPSPSGSGGAAPLPGTRQASQRLRPVQSTSAKLPGAGLTQSTQAAANAEQDTNSVPTAAQPNAPGAALARPTNGSARLSGAEPNNVNPSAASPSPPTTGQSEYRRAEQYLNGKGTAQDYGQAAQWFWRSLEAGYTEAAVPLANLYLKGNGVSQSCTQARILLDVAAQKSNTQAIQQLGQLPENCQ